MKNIVNLSRCLAAVLLLSVSACVKDPKPETPHPPAPEWLLTKIEISEKRGEPGRVVTSVYHYTKPD